MADYIIDKIKIKRGLKANLPILDIGEPAFCTDTNEYFVGTAEGNKLVNDLSEITTTVNEKADKTYVDTELDKKATQSDLDTTNQNVTNLTSDLAQTTKVVSVKSKGATGENSDDANAFESAIREAISSIEVTSQSRIDNFSIQIDIPAGYYNVERKITIDRDDFINAFSVANTVTIYLKGSTGTFIQLKNNETMFELLGVRVVVEDITFLNDKDNVYTGTAFDLGSTTVLNSKAVTQSTFNRCRFLYFKKIMNFNQVFDTSFYECFFGGQYGNGDVGIAINPHDSDNSNNINFYRCHWELGDGATFFKATGRNDPKSYHGVFNFYGCHFETTKLNTVIAELKYCRYFNFIGGEIIQNTNDSTSTGEEAVPLFKIDDCDQILMQGLAIHRIGNATGQNFTNKIFQLGGNTSGVKIRDCSVFTGKSGVSNPSINDLIQHNINNPLADSEYRTFIFDNIAINDVRLVPYSNDQLFLSNKGKRNEFWRVKHDSEENVRTLKLGFSEDINGKSYWKDALNITPHGELKPNFLSSAYKKTLSTGEIMEVDISKANNSVLRGVYLFYAGDSGQAYALVFSDGGALHPLSVGDKVSLNTTDVASKYNLYVNSTTKRVEVKNNVSTSRPVCIIPFAF